MLLRSRLACALLVLSGLSD